MVASHCKTSRWRGCSLPKQSETLIGSSGARSATVAGAAGMGSSSVAVWKMWQLVAAVCAALG